MALSSQALDPLPPFKTFRYYNKTIYDLGLNHCIYVDSFKEFPIKIHFRKFLPKLNGRGFYPSTEGLSLNPDNFSFLLEVIDKKFEENLINVKVRLMDDLENLTQARENRHKRKREEEEDADVEDNDD